MEVSGANWYVVHTYSGYENKVKAAIERAVENRNLSHLIFDVKIPVTTSVEIDSKGREKIVEEKIFPAYVFVKMIMNDESWHVIRNITGVTGFVGPGSKPVPLTEAEMRNLGINANKTTVEYAVGETIIAISGVWEDTVGEIKSINETKQTVTINVDMFGRETPVELGFDEIRRM